MINATSVINHVKQGQYPSSWKVYRSRGNYGCTSWGTILAIGFLIALIVILVQYPSEIVAVIVFLGVPCVICAFVALKSKANTDARLNSTLVLLPDGVVQCIAGNLNNPGWLSYPNINRLELAQKTEVSGNEDGINTYHYYWLDVYSKDGSYSQFRVWDGFGNAEFLSKTIIAAYNYYGSRN